MVRPTKLLPIKARDEIKERLKLYDQNTPRQIAREYGISQSYVYLLHHQMKEFTSQDDN